MATAAWGSGELSAAARKSGQLKRSQPSGRRCSTQRRMSRSTSIHRLARPSGQSSQAPLSCRSARTVNGGSSSVMDCIITVRSTPSGRSHRLKTRTDSTADKRTTWTKPDASFVIPLAAVQGASDRRRSLVLVNESVPSLTSIDTDRSTLSKGNEAGSSAPTTPSTSQAASPVSRHKKRASVPRLPGSSSLPLSSPTRGRHHTSQGLPIPPLPSSSSAPTFKSSSRRSRAATAPAGVDLHGSPASSTSHLTSTPDAPPVVFNQPRVGILRRKVPLSVMLQHQATPLSSPLLHHPRALQSSALQAFRHILGT